MEFTRPDDETLGLEPWPANGKEVLKARMIVTYDREPYEMMIRLGRYPNSAHPTIIIASQEYGKWRLIFYRHFKDDEYQLSYDIASAMEYRRHMPQAELEEWNFQRHPLTPENPVI